MNPQPRDAPDVNVARESSELARYRTLLALDRTTLAWIRTTLTMASFGLGLVSFFRSLRAQAPTAETVHLHVAVIRFGTGLIVLGIIATMLFTVSHFFALRRLRQGKAPVLSQWPLSITVAMLLAIVGLDALWWLFAR